MSAGNRRLAHHAEPNVRQKMVYARSGVEPLVEVGLSCANDREQERVGAKLLVPRSVWVHVHDRQASAGLEQAVGFGEDIPAQAWIWGNKMCRCGEGDADWSKRGLSMSGLSMVGLDILRGGHPCASTDREEQRTCQRGGSERIGRSMFCLSVIGLSMTGINTIGLCMIDLSMISQCMIGRDWSYHDWSKRDGSYHDWSKRDWSEHDWSKHD